MINDDMVETYETKAKFNGYSVKKVMDEENSYTGLTDGGEYDISIRFGKVNDQLPTKEMVLGLCSECICITDLGTEKHYRYSSFDDAFSIWKISANEEEILWKINESHDTYKHPYMPQVYLCGPSYPAVYGVYRHLKNSLTCQPIVCNPFFTSTRKDMLSKAINAEVDAMCDSSCVFMIGDREHMTPEMKIIDNIATTKNIPVIYTNVIDVAE